MNFIKNWKFSGLLIVVFMFSVFDLLIANNEAVRFWVQNHLWKAPAEIKAVINSEIGQPYTVTEVDEGGENSTGKFDELKALLFWFNFKVGDEFIATSTLKNKNNSVYFVALKGVLGSYHRNLLKHTQPDIKESCFFGFPNKFVSINEGEIQASFVMMLDDLYVFDASTLSSIDISDEALSEECEANQQL